jgi:hypothetical protein
MLNDEVEYVWVLEYSAVVVLKRGIIMDVVAISVDCIQSFELEAPPRLKPIFHFLTKPFDPFLEAAAA